MIAMVAFRVPWIVGKAWCFVRIPLKPKKQMLDSGIMAFYDVAQLRRMQS
jgi:hypothetical protein